MSSKWTVLVAMAMVACGGAEVGTVASGDGPSNPVSAAPSARPSPSGAPTARTYSALKTGKEAPTLVAVRNLRSAAHLAPRPAGGTFAKIDAGLSIDTPEPGVTIWVKSGLDGSFEEGRYDETTGEFEVTITLADNAEGMTGIALSGAVGYDTFLSGGAALSETYIYADGSTFTTSYEAGFYDHETVYYGQSEDGSHGELHELVEAEDYWQWGTWTLEGAYVMTYDNVFTLDGIAYLVTDVDDLTGPFAEGDASYESVYWADGTSDGTITYHTAGGALLYTWHLDADGGGSLTDPDGGVTPLCGGEVCE